jgi:hypothetical protein
MYNKIFDLCKVRNKGLIYENDSSPTPRVQFLMDLLDSEGIEYVLDKFEFKKTFAYNIVMKGISNKMVVAHHDIVNPNIDNANDNSASLINAIMVKKLRPDMNVVLLDGEEIGGIGSQRVSEQINNGDFGSIEWVLNFELTGKGGKHFFIGDYPGVLSDRIKSLFDCPIVQTPFNDSVIFNKNGIDSVVINPLPPVDKVTKVKWNDDTYLDFKLLFNCHNEKDTLETIDIADMKEFVEEIVLKIIS